MSADTFHDLTLNNGTAAVFLGVDFWSRPYYRITHDERQFVVCCTELNGTHLHYYCPRNDTDGEPDYALPEPFQPQERSQ